MFTLFALPVAVKVGGAGARPRWPSVDPMTWAIFASYSAVGPSGRSFGACWRWKLWNGFGLVSSTQPSFT